MINNIADCISYFHCNNSRTRSLMDRKLWSHEEYRIRDIGARERELDSSQISQPVERNGEREFEIRKS